MKIKGKKLKWRTNNPALVLYTTAPDPQGLLKVHRTERRKALQHYAKKQGETA